MSASVIALALSPAAAASLALPRNDSVSRQIQSLLFAMAMASLALAMAAVASGLALVAAVSLLADWSAQPLIYHIESNAVENSLT